MLPEDSRRSTAASPDVECAFLRGAERRGAGADAAGHHLFPQVMDLGLETTVLCVNRRQKHFQAFSLPVGGGSAGSVNKTSTSLLTTSLSATVEARRKSPGSEFFFQCTGTQEGDKRDWHTQTYKRKQASDQQILYGDHQIVCLM